jgi:hypothetical protein
VAAPRCTEAGALATLALLHGAQARAWLHQQGVTHWIVDGDPGAAHPPAPHPSAAQPAAHAAPAPHARPLAYAP